MQGLRAPAIGQAFPKAATAVSGRASAVAMMAAASIGMGLGGVNAAAYQPTLQVPASVQRTAQSVAQIAQMEAQASQGLLGNLAQKAPSLGQGTARPLSSALAGGVAPTVERAIGGGSLSGGAALLGAAGRALSPLAKFASPLNPITAVLPDLLFPEGTQQGSDEANALKNAAKGPIDRDAARKKAARKGDKFGDGQNPTLRDPTAGTQAGVSYQVNYSTHFQGQADGQGFLILPGPISGMIKEASQVYQNEFNFYIGYGNGQRAGVIGNGDEHASATITAINRVGSGQDDPIPDPVDPSGGLFLPQPNSNLPVLPSMPRSGSLPATATSRPPSTGAPTPSDGLRNPDRPSQPAPTDPSKPGGEDSPVVPQTPLNPANASQPGQGINSQAATLPNLPSAPTTGSASLPTPIFPATFTDVPGIRSENPYQPAEEPPKEEQRKPDCKDPCIQELLDNAKNSKQKETKNEPVSLTVQVFKNCAGGNANFESKTIKIPAGQEDQYTLLYQQLANLEAQQCTPVEAIAGVPDWWQVRIEGRIPQLILHFAQKNDDGNLGRGDYTMSIPHPASLEKPPFSPITPYQKGSAEGILTLNDNSKLIVNAYSETEAERVISEALLFIDPKFTVGSVVKIGIRRGQALKEIKVYPKYGKLFSTGLQNMKPDWTVYFRS